MLLPKGGRVVGLGVQGSTILTCTPSVPKRLSSLSAWLKVKDFCVKLFHHQELFRHRDFQGWFTVVVVFNSKSRTYNYSVNGQYAQISPKLGTRTINHIGRGGVIFISLTSTTFDHERSRLHVETTTVLSISNGLDQNPMTTQQGGHYIHFYLVFSVTYYLKVCNAISLLPQTSFFYNKCQIGCLDIRAYAHL